MQELLLRERHRAAGATFGERDLFEVPLSYGAPLEEYRRAQSQAAVLDRSSRGILRFSGPDRESWLHGMTTSDVKGLPVGAGQRSLVCSIKGKVLGLGILTKREEELFFDLDPLCREKVREALERLLITEEVTVVDEPGETALLSVVGPLAWPLVARALGAAAGEAPEKLFAYQERPFGGGSLGLRRSRLGILPAFDLFAPREIAPLLFDTLREGGALLGEEAAEILRIEGGEPRYGQDVGETTIPQEAGLDEAISYTKGCYVGQETIARLHYRGHTNRSLRGFLLTGELSPRPGAAIVAEGEERGKVTSSCVSPTLQAPIAMGYIRREFSEAGKEVEIEVEGGRAKAFVRDLPFAALAS